MRGMSISRKGISDLPMQLLIGACIISFAVPIFHSAYEDLSEKVTDDRITREMDTLLMAMEEVLSGGKGSRKVLEMELSGFGSCSVGSVIIGGDPSSGDERYMIRYHLTTGHSGRFSLDPPFPMSSPEGDALEIGGGTYSMEIIRTDEGGTDHIRVSIE